MKVYFDKIESFPYSKLVVYNSLNRLPFTLKLNNVETLSETIYARNLHGGNLIEFRFDNKTKLLAEITLVSVQIDTIEINKVDIPTSNQFFNCYLDETSELCIARPIKVLRSNSFLTFIWGDGSLNYYPVSEKGVIGVDSDNCLCSFSLINLNEKIVFDILGV